MGTVGVQTLNALFAGCDLTYEFGISLGEALRAYKGLRNFKLDLGGYSIKKNLLHDTGYTNHLMIRIRAHRGGIGNVFGTYRIPGIESL